MLKFHNIKDILQKVDDRYGLGMLESAISSNWYNIFCTLWLNFRCLALTQAWKLPIAVYGRPRFFNLSGKIRIEGKVSFAMIHFNKTRPGSPSNMGIQTEIMNQGTIIFHGKGTIGTGNKIRVAPRAVLEIGTQFLITDMVNVGCYKSIIIGDQSWITHRCQVFDANYHFLANLNNRTINKWTKDIIIGKGCWVCNSTTITGGSIIPDFTTIASNSLVNKDYSSLRENSILGGIPAKLIAEGYRRVDNRSIELAIHKHFATNPSTPFPIPQDIQLSDISNVIG